MVHPVKAFILFNPLTTQTMSTAIPFIDFSLPLVRILAPCQKHAYDIKTKFSKIANVLCSYVLLNTSVVLIFQKLKELMHSPVILTSTIYIL